MALNFVRRPVAPNYLILKINIRIINTEFDADLNSGKKNVATKNYFFANFATKLLLCRWFRFAQLAKGKKSRP